MSIVGPDVSQYQPEIDWGRVASMCPFAIARAVRESWSEAPPAGWPSGTDHGFPRNWPAMKAAGLIRGAYLFINDSVAGEQQADRFIQVVDQAGGWRSPGDVPPIVDFERSNLANCRDAIARLKDRLGGKVILYSGDPGIGRLGADYIWIPHYGIAEFDWGDLPTAWDRSELILWQYKSQHNNATSLMDNAPGYTGEMDMNVLMFGRGEITDLRRLAGLEQEEDMGFVEFKKGWQLHRDGKPKPGPDADPDLLFGWNVRDQATTQPKPEVPGPHTHVPEDIPHVHDEGKTGPAIAEEV